MLQRIALRLLSIYQAYVRILLPSSCRFTPSCSEYARQAIVQFGLFKGAIKGINRLLRCHPFSKKAGYDPIV